MRTHTFTGRRLAGAALWLVLAAAPAGAAAPGAATPASGPHGAPTSRPLLPRGAAARSVTVVPSRRSTGAAASVTVLTQAVAIKETGPAATVAHFGEVYAFAPSFIAVHRDQPTRITFWNLQPDDVHNFVLLDPRDRVLMNVQLAPLTKTAYVFTFHRDGVFAFECTLHQPAMSGQILVLPPLR